MSTLVGAAFLGVSSVGGASRSRGLLCSRLGDREAVYAKVVADAVDDQESPAPVDHRSKDEVKSEVPEFKVRRHRSEGRAWDREVRVVHYQSASDHRHQHHRPVWEGLTGEMSQNNLGGHAPKDQRHGQAV